MDATETKTATIKATIEYTYEDETTALSMNISSNGYKFIKMMKNIAYFMLLFSLALLFIRGFPLWLHQTRWFIFILSLLFISLHFYLKLRFYSNTFEKNGDNNVVHNFTITEKGVDNEVGITILQKTWKEYRSAAISTTMIMLYTEKLKCDLLPKQSFTEEEFTQITAWVKENMKKIVEFEPLEKSLKQNHQ